MRSGDALASGTAAGWSNAVRRSFVEGPRDGGSSRPPGKVRHPALPSCHTPAVTPLLPNVTALATVSGVHAVGLGGATLAAASGHGVCSAGSAALADAGSAPVPIAASGAWGLHLC